MCGSSPFLRPRARLIYHALAVFTFARTPSATRKPNCQILQRSLALQAICELQEYVFNASDGIRRSTTIQKPETALMHSL